MTKRADPASYERQRRARNPEHFRELSRKSYAKHREKRQAEANAKRAADPEASRVRQRVSYAKHREKRAAEARERRAAKREELAAQAKAKYHANRDEICERRRRLSQHEEAKAKQREAMRQWMKNNPDKVAIQRAKILLSEQTGIAYPDIPNDLAQAKVEQLKIARWVREQLAAIATEARRAETTKIGSVHESAGRKASPKTPRPSSKHLITP